MSDNLWSSFFWCFRISYIKVYLEIFDILAPPSNCTSTPTEEKNTKGKSNQVR